MRFAHCADVHLGGPNGRERMEAFEKLLTLCEEQEIPVLLIAGDLFDAPRVKDAVRIAAFDALRRHPYITALLIAGNHDPLVPAGNYEGELPKNLYVFGTEWSCVEVPACGVRVWGASFGDTLEHAPFSPVRRRRQLTEGLYDIGMIHGELVSPNGSSDMRAVTEKSIGETGLIYLGLGHIHEPSEVLRAGRTYYAYSGTIQGAGFADVGERGAYVGEITEEGFGIQFVPLCVSRCREETLDISREFTTQDALRRCRENVRLPQGDRVKLRLVGTRATGVDMEALQRMLDENVVLLLDETRFGLSAQEISKENSLRGAFARRMLQRIAQLERAGEDAGAAQLALQLGLEAFEGEVTADAH